ncbi:MAG: hypothetical protein FJ295_12820, partial [Planctomycetes bacterium]|nr:hypothetical protein [Planctomycetota bacterium]
MTARRTLKTTPRSRPDRLATQDRQRSKRRRGLLFEGLEPRQLLASDWQNSLNRLDVSDDGWVTPLDAISIINELNRPSIIDSENRLPPRPSGMPPGNWLDTSGEGLLTATDAILVINALNRDTGLPTVTAALQNDTGPNGTFNDDGNTLDQRITGTTRDELLGVKKLEAQLDGGNFVSVTYDRRTGAFSFEPGLATDGSADGTHTVSFRARDLRDNESTVFSITFVLDTIAPAAPTGTRLSASSDTGASSSDGITNDTTPTIVGDAAVGTMVTVRSGGSLLGQASASTPWSITTHPLADGKQTLGIQAHDLAGNASTVVDLNITIDTLPPSAPTGLRIDAASDSGASDSDGITNDSTPTVVGLAESQSRVELFVDGLSSGSADSSGSWSITTLLLGDGDHDLTARAIDLAGNVGLKSAATRITIDTLAPAPPDGMRLAAASDSGSSNSDGITNKSAPTILGVSESGVRVTVKVDGGTIGQFISSGDWSIDSPALADGNHSVTATTADTAGNVSEPSLELSIQIDTTAPGSPTQIALASSSDSGLSDSDGITNDATPTITGLAESQSRVELFVDGLSSGSADSSGSW